MKINEVIDDNIQVGNHNDIFASDEKMQELCDYIKKNCSDILTIYQTIGKYLFRGVNGMPLVFLANPRTDRKPRDSSMEFQVVIDNKLRTVGFKALRSNSIFCCGNQQYASKYGNNYIIFPRNGFNYTWSESLCDYYQQAKDNKVVAHNTLPPKEYVEKYKFKDTDIEKAIKSGHEIYINEPYVAISYPRMFRGVSLFKENLKI